MKEKDWIVLVVIAGIVIYLITEHKKKNREIDELKKKNKKLYDSLNVQNEFLKMQQEINLDIIEKNELTDEIKEQLKKLVDEYKGINEDITTELLRVSAFIDIKAELKAIETLVKIIENLLKELYSENEEFSTKYKRPRLVDYIEFAKSENKISKDEFHFINGLREIRNEEAHELNVQKEKNWIISAFLTSISVIVKLGTMIKTTI